MDEPDAYCTECGEPVFAEDLGLVEGFERFGRFLCEECYLIECEIEDE